MVIILIEQGKCTNYQVNAFLEEIKAIIKREKGMADLLKDISEVQTSGIFLIKGTSR